MTPLINYNKILIAQRNCTSCGGKHAYDPSVGVSWAKKSNDQVPSLNFAYHSSIPVRLNGTVMLDSVCGKQAEQDDFQCVSNEEGSLAPFFMVKESELPIFA